MKIRAKRFSKKSAFTLVEILVTVGIIAVLLGLLLPALSMVRKMAVTVKQKSQFAAIEIGIEAFRAESPGFGDYPPSNYNIFGGSSVAYTGAQQLAEALIGKDGFGWHPESQFRKDGTDGNGKTLYKPDIDSDSINYPTQAEINNNLRSRKGPYLELEKANAIKLQDLYIGSELSPSGLDADSYVLTDMFGLVKHIGTGKKTGMPILYYRADTTKINHELDPEEDWDTDDKNVYDYRNNYVFYYISPPWDLSQVHPFSANHSLGPKEGFYARTLNLNFTNPRRPYNSQSFILHSAGHDGLYGTPDDVFNFDEAN